MSPYLRKVRTASGATAVQIAVKEGRHDKVLAHLGSAHNDAELAALMEVGHQRLDPGQQTLDLNPIPSTGSTGVIVSGQRSALLVQVQGPLAPGGDLLGSGQQDGELSVSVG